MNIQVLPPLLANQIAAGEVIERPASVVKELLENAKDAGASRIQIDIKHGGLQLIRITDNGHGIVKQDLPLAVRAHATSKIKQLSDLFAIQTLGFRGEALASITSISKFTLASKVKESETAFQLMLAGNQSEPCIEPCAHPQGTTISVAELFFNTPVRRKFLKSARSEFIAIDKVVRSFALSCAHVAIVLTHDGKSILNLPAVNKLESSESRVAKIMGKNFIDNATQIEIQHGDFHLQGWLSLSSYMRSQNDKQYFYINNRMVRDKLVNHAIKQAYEELLYPGRHPAFVLYFSLPVQEIDVNVHPTKHEVRFKQARLVHDFLVSQIRQAIDEKPAMNVQQRELPQIAEPQRQYTVNTFDFSQEKEHSPSQYISISENHVVFPIAKHKVLCNVKALFDEQVRPLLQEDVIAARPVLVPLRLTVNAAQKNNFMAYQSHFKTLGLSFDLIDEKTLLVRTIPVILPQLDFEMLLEKLDSKKLIIDPSKEQLIALLLSATPVDCELLDEEQLTAMKSILSQRLMSKPHEKGFYKSLDEKDARQLLNG